MVRVLLVDDSPQVRRLVRVLLESHGHVMLEAADGHDGLRMMRDERPDIVILDLMMPGPTGLDVLREMRVDAHLATLPVIILTASGLEESKVEALASGASGFMEKPFSPAELVKMIIGLTRP